jgi:hypothetical protein
MHTLNTPFITQSYSFLYKPLLSNSIPQFRARPIHGLSIMPKINYISSPHHNDKKAKTLTYLYVSAQSDKDK